MKTNINGKRFNQAFGGSSNQRGWSLVEILVVTLIIAVLATSSMALLRRGQQGARSATCMSNVKQIGMALLMHAQDNHQKLINLQPPIDRDTGKRPEIWTVQLATEGYLWDGNGTLPCGTGVWSCPDCDFASNTHGGYGVVEDTIFVYGEARPQGVTEPGSLRLSKIANPEDTWLVGDACPAASTPNKSWYAIWSNPSRWGSHGPAPRHGGKVNVCMADGHVESLRISEIEERKLTSDIVR